MRAHLGGDALTVSLDGDTVWEGSIGTDGTAFDGPVGMRSDNGRFEVELFESAPERARSLPMPGVTADPAFRSYRAWGIPMVVLVGGDGRVRSVIHPRKLDAAIVEEVLAGRVPDVEQAPKGGDPKGAENYFCSADR